MSEEELSQYKIIQILNPLEILLPAAIILIVVVAFHPSELVVAGFETNT